jgi:hypothetical protein
MFSRKARELEALVIARGRPAQPTDQERAEHRSYVVSAVLAAVAFIEASVNELIESSPLPNMQVGGGEGGLSGEDRSALADLPDAEAKLSTLDRAQLILHLLHREPFDPGRKPFQDMQLIVRLRNALVHYQPEWYAAGTDQDLSKGLRKPLADRRFALNPFFPDINPFLWDRCLGHGCAEWSWRTALDFADSFFKKLGITPIYDAHRDELKG